MRNDHDVIIVGAGPAGSATAFFLAQQGIDVLLLDKASFPRDKTCGDCISPRGQVMLQQMGLSETLARHAHRVPMLQLHSPNGERICTPLVGGAQVPSGTLVIPRMLFDDILRTHAIAAGATFRVGRVSGLLGAPGHIHGVQVGDETIRSALVVLATGASTTLPRMAGMLPSPPRMSIAARRYYEDIPRLSPHLEIVFHEVPLPGYGWIFPTGPARANVGYWYSGKWPVSARAGLAYLSHHHPHMGALLDAATPFGPLKSYPIRTDFLHSVKMCAGVLAVGEAIGLVNPLTGEGIDYALESGKLAARTIATAFATGAPTYTRLQSYIHDLNAHFRTLFRIMSLAHRVYFNRPGFSMLFGRGDEGQELANRMIRVCFGGDDPTSLFRPNVIFALWRSALCRPS